MTSFIRKTSFLLLTAGSFLFAAAQTNNDKKATQLLNDVSKTYKSYKTMKVSFSLLTEDKAKKTNTTEAGSLLLKGDKFKLDFGGQEIYCNGKIIWTYIKEVNEVQIDKYAPKPDDINPTEIFTIYQKGFLYKYDGTTKAKDGTVLEKVLLTPKDKKRPYFSITLEIHPTKKQIVNMVVNYKNGIKQTYTIKDLQPNTEMDNTLFNFDVKSKPGVEVVDLRD